MFFSNDIVSLALIYPKKIKANMIILKRCESNLVPLPMSWSPSHSRCPQLSVPSCSSLPLLIHLLLKISTTHRATPLGQSTSLVRPAGVKESSNSSTPLTQYPPSCSIGADLGEAETSAGVLALGQQMAWGPLGYHRAPSWLPSGCRMSLLRGLSTNTHRHTRAVLLHSCTYRSLKPQLSWTPNPLL